MIRASVWPHNLALLREARSLCEKAGLATMSGCAQARRVLGDLDLRGLFDFVATADDKVPGVIGRAGRSPQGR